jgi:hypothetical protein
LARTEFRDTPGCEEYAALIGVRVTRLVVLAAAALLLSAGSAYAFKPTIGPPVALLTTLKDDAVKQLDAHLSPGVSILIDIGWQTNVAPGQTSIALTGGETLTNLLGHKVRGCQIAVDQPLFDGATVGNPTWEQEVVTHEVFHCYQEQIEGSADPEITATEPWLQEGLARWVDMETSSPPIPYSLASLQAYFASSTVSLFNRKAPPGSPLNGYDAVGFWGHLQDDSGNLWARIPYTLTQAAGGSQDAVDAALKGLNLEKFFDTWGSSAANQLAGGTPWIANSPDPSAGFAAPTQTITPKGPNSPVSVKLDPYSTNQLMISMPAAPPGSIETLRIALGSAYGRFGVTENYTTPEIATMTFCGGPSGCGPKKVTPATWCGAGEVSIPPPPTTPLPADPLLAVAAAQTGSTVVLEYASVTVVQATSGTCVPAPTSHGTTTGTATTAGDPHLVDFDGGLFTFQSVGEFTLLKSTKDNLQIQVRQQPFPHSQAVAVNTAAAMQVGKSVVEVDSTGREGVTVLVDHKRLHGKSAQLPGGDSVTLVHAGFQLPHGDSPDSLCKKNVKSGPELKGCEQVIGAFTKGFTVADVRWSDGTTVMAMNDLTGGGGLKWEPSLSVNVQVAHSRLRHLTGLLGNADVPFDREFRGRSGQRFNGLDILYGDGGTPAMAQVLYDQFGASWRVSQRESLFTYARGKSTRSYTIADFPQEPFNAASAPVAKQLQAVQLCQAGGNKDPNVLRQCEYDVLASGNPSFAGGDEPLEHVSSAYPHSPQQPPPRPPIHPIDLGAGSNPPQVAYDPGSGNTYVAWVDSSNSSIDVCTIVAGGSSCNAGAGPDRLVDPLGSSGTFFYVALVVQPGGAVVVLGQLDGAGAAAGYGGDGVVAWSSPAGGSAFAGGNQGLADGGRLLANSARTGDSPSGGATALGDADIGVYGDLYPFGSGFTDFDLSTPAPSPTPVADRTGDFGDQEGAAGTQVASIPDPGAPGQYIVVAVGGDSAAPPGCPSGSLGTGFGVGVGTPAALQTQSAWSASYFHVLACQAQAPVLAGGGPNGGSIGVLENEGPGLSASGSDGVYYRAFVPASASFAAPVLVSDETALTLSGATGLAASQDPGGGAYAIWLDRRGYVLVYSSDGGASWPVPGVIGLSPGAGDAVIAGAGQSNAQIAYTAGSQEYLVPVSYLQLAGG